MATYTEESGYLKTSTDKYDAIDYVNMYDIDGKSTTPANEANKICFLPDGADLWDQFTQMYLIKKACDKIIAGGGGYTTGNCYPMRDGTSYWASAEYSSTNAWYCYTNNAYLGIWYDKWGSRYVRPSFAIEAV